jgi:hypothetical protein
MSIAVTPTSVTAKTTRRVAMELRWRKLRAAVAVLLACTSVLPFSAAHGAEEASVDGGYVVPGTRLWLGGDVTLEFGVPEGEPAFLGLDDVSLLARYEVVPRLALFTELRLENTLEWIEGVGVERGSADISIERLYAEGLLTPHLSVRAGKFFTPFGLWNVIHRAPLTWTVDAPEVVEETFPIRATGLSLVYQTTWHGWSFDATGYGPGQDELALRHTDQSGLMGGGRTAVGRPLGPAYGAVGVSGMAFEDHDTGRWADAYGADLELTFRGHQLMGEVEYTHLRGPGAGHDSGFYLQDAIPLTETLYGVLRVERLHLAGAGSGTGGLVGLFWRPRPYLIFKADYQFGDRLKDTLEPGFIGSVVLFF